MTDLSYEGSNEEIYYNIYKKFGQNMYRNNYNRERTLQIIIIMVTVIMKLVKELTSATKGCTKSTKCVRKRMAVRKAPALRQKGKLNVMGI